MTASAIGSTRRVLQERDAERLEPGQRARRPHRHRNADDRSGNREEQALGQRLLDQVASATRRWRREWRTPGAAR